MLLARKHIRFIRKRSQNQLHEHLVIALAKHVSIVVIAEDGFGHCESPMELEVFDVGCQSADFNEASFIESSWNSWAA